MAQLSGQISGLSPLARGTRVARCAGYCRNRFIPAGAGNTLQRHNGGQMPPVYPRWRGEHEVLIDIPFFMVGLSPLARGTHKRRQPPDRSGRFIPAGAGNTSRQNRAPPAGAGNTISEVTMINPISVYPRWRGEHVLEPTLIPQKYGLSPLARGTHCHMEVAKLPLRFIPAGAGNTSPHATPLFSVPVYPRWRGEHTNPEISTS